MSNQDPLIVNARTVRAATAQVLRENYETERQEAQEMAKKERNRNGVVRRRPNVENTSRMIDEAARAVNEALDALAVANQRAEQMQQGGQAQRVIDARRQQRGGGPR
ncbi:hypothetical protein [Nocardioides terrisoli]|uniref:hypothetical protein n=1 Tax=Nocardioides terrisoli TaxID=3388267 RepID=UPI00287B67EE|nr:hypothetical protein [Nocardioides marmorisolisilvae]